MQSAISTHSHPASFVHIPQRVGRFPARWRSNNQRAHCYPRFTPGEVAVLYTSDLTGYSNTYLVEVGEFDELPDLS